MVARQHDDGQGANNNEAASQARRDPDKEEILRADLACEVQKLKVKHQRVLKNISLF